GHSAFNKQQAAFSINTDNIEVLDGTRYSTHVTRHFLAGKYTTGVLSHTRGAGYTVRHRVTVTLVLTRETVTFDGTGIAFTNGGTGNVHLLTRFEDSVHGEFVAGVVFGGNSGIEAEFFEGAAGFGAGFGIVTCQRFGDARRTAFAVSDLNSRIAIYFW